MRGIRMFVLTIATFSMIFLLYGCGEKKPASGNDKVVVRINRYEMTTGEFKDEAKLAMPARYVTGDAEKAKEEFLDEIITKQVLLQEAQRENFDKNKEFRKEIERYWEQALLKLLIKEKMRELSKQLIVREGKKEDQHKKIQEALDRWIKDLRRRANIKIYKDNLKEVEIK